MKARFTNVDVGGGDLILTVIFRCPACNKELEAIPIGKRENGKLILLNTSAEYDVLIGRKEFTEEDTTCHTFLCSCSDTGLTLSAEQADILNEWGDDELSEFCDGWREGGNKLDFLQVSFSGRNFRAGDQIPQHLNEAGREALGLKSCPFIVVLNGDDAPYTVAENQG